jgi:hypothetical protein
MRAGLWFFVLLSALLPSLQAFAQQEPTPSSPSSASSSPTDETVPAAASALIPDLTPDASGGLSQAQMQALFRVVAEKDRANHKRQRDYTFLKREVENKLDGDGQTKSTEVRSYEVLEIYGEQVQRLIAKDDRPLDAKDAAKEEEKIQKMIDKRKDESDDDRRKREEKEEKEFEDGRKFLDDVADAYNFKLVGTELVDGREAWVINGEPRAGFEPKVKDAKFLPKFRGRVWIDKGDLQLAKMDIEAIDTVSVGWLVARIHKGSRYMLEQTRVNDEVWLPRHSTFRLDARVALFKGYNTDSDREYRDYKKFGTTSKIVGMGEVKEQK